MHVANAGPEANDACVEVQRLFRIFDPVHGLQASHMEHWQQKRVMLHECQQNVVPQLYLLEDEVLSGWVRV